MKRILANILLIGMTLGLVACGSSKVNDDAIDKFIMASSKMNEIKATNYEVMINTDDNDEKMQIKLSGGIDGRGNLKLTSFMDAEANGTKFNELVKVYVQDELIYMDVFEEKSTYAVSSYAEIFNFLLKSEQVDEVTNIEKQKKSIKENVNEASIKDNVIKFVLNDEKVNEIIKEASNNEASKLGLKNMNIGLKNAMLEVELDGEFIGNGTFSFEMKTSTDEVKEENMKMLITFKLDKINEDFVIEMPDLSEYPEAEDISKLLGK